VAAVVNSIAQIFIATKNPIQQFKNFNDEKRTPNQ
jgi:hypothetical protein